MNGNFVGVQTMTEEKYKGSWRVQDCMGRTALHYLVQTDITGQILEWLLANPVAAEIDLNAMTNGGVTPLMLAVKLNNEKIVEILLKASANPFLKDQLG